MAASDIHGTVRKAFVYFARPIPRANSPRPPLNFFFREGKSARGGRRFLRGVPRDARGGLGGFRGAGLRGAVRALGRPGDTMNGHDTALFPRLVGGWINADFGAQIRIFQHFSRSDSIRKSSSRNQLLQNSSKIC